MERKVVQRWIDSDESLPAILSEAVRDAQLDVPDEARFERMIALAAKTASTPGAAGTALQPVESTAFVKYGAVLLLGAVAIATFWLLHSQNAIAPEPGNPRPIQHESMGSAARGSVTASASHDQPAVSVSTAVDAGSPIPTIESARVSTRPRASERPAARAAQPRPSVEAAPSALDVMEEIRLLRDCKRDLATSPVRAYQRILEHERRFSHGSFVEEREALAIEVLFELGRTAEALQRAERFRAAYPRSAYRRRVAQLLDTSHLR